MQPVPTAFGKAVGQYAASYGLLWYEPAKVQPERPEQGELDSLGKDAAPAPKEIPNEVMSEHNVSVRQRYFQEWAERLLLPWWWTVPLVFCSLQLASLVATGDSLFGVLTGGVVESLRLAATGRAMRWHMLGAIAMWAVGASQFMLKPLRHGSLAWVHRGLGKVFLGLWALVAGPTAFYLSLFCGTGRIRAHFFMTLFAIISMDTTVYAYYYFWRAWLVARRRANGSASLVLHGKAMSAGIYFTMIILWQRPCQAVLIAVRGILLAAAEAMPAAWAWPRWGLETVTLAVLDHNMNLAVTTVVIGIPSLLLDGPRSRLVRSAFNLEAAQYEELFGSLEPGRAEMLFWRLRLPAYLLLRAVVTRAWTRDPDA